MYESFFNLQLKPFDLLPDPRFVYLSKSYKKALTYLDYGIRERSGFILLTGEVGSGKTTLIRNLLNKNYENIVLSMIFNTRVNSEQLLSMINEDFGLSSQGKDKVSLLRDLNEFLIDQFAGGRQPILIIDEAQNFSPELLEEVRMLSNLEISNSKLLQIILVGQPELRTILAVPELRQLRQRISINCHLQALSSGEIRQYITRRLEVAGNSSAVEFQADTFDTIFRFSRGIPRLINIICDYLMLSAFSEETNTITLDMVRDVIDDLDFENYYWMAAAERQMVHQDRKIVSLAEKQALAPEFHSMCTDISQRIESIIQNIPAPLHPALDEQSSSSVSFQEAIKAHAVKTDAHILELKKNLEELRNTISVYEKVETFEESKIGSLSRVS